MNSTENRVIEFIKEHDLLKNGDRVVVSLSGGSDSVFLLVFLHKWQRLFGIEIAAFHINHKLRGRDSDKDEEYCISLCNRLGVRIETKTVNVAEYCKKNNTSTEEGARNLRYDALYEFCKSNSYNLLVTGHNRDDNTETILLNMAKGAGLDGLSGIPIERQLSKDDSGIIVARPILCLSKNEIRDYLMKKKIQYCKDKTNTDHIYQRNYVREEIVPKIKVINPSLDAKLLQQSLLFRELRNYISKTVAAEFIAKHVSRKKGEVWVSLFGINDNNFFPVGSALRVAVKEDFGIDLSYNETRDIIRMVHKKSGSVLKLRKGLHCYLDRRYLVITKKKNLPKEISIKIRIGEQIETNEFFFESEFVERKEVRFNELRQVEYLNADNLDLDDIYICNWIKGDSFKPLGMNGKVKISDYLVNNKIPLLEKNKILTLKVNQKIMWLMGYVIDDEYRIKDDTQKVLKLKFFYKEKR